ncbi:renin receptor isoform X3 [Temnothorax curvispinosus]|uniref:Renin receptor isoform X3 n=1 Tax=Temnothorax curvispinosus TaxID=300111 RepID=A0A6J1RD20_9HYME|nr:renin receptor isoform X3 [Temnothorax curvispinosus]
MFKLNFILERSRSFPGHFDACLSFLVHANGNLAVLHSPDSIEFTMNGPIEQSSVKEIFPAALGYTGKQRESYTEQSIAIWDPFALPKALVAIPIDGVEELPIPTYKAKVWYPLIVDEAEETTWQAIRSRVEERSNDNTLVRINLGDGVDALGQSALGELKPANMEKEKLKSLNSEVEEDRKFVEEIQLLHAVADNAAKKHDSGTDVYWLVVSGLKPVLDLHGNTSAAAEEASTLLSDAIDHVSNAFVNTYDGKIVVAAFTNDASKVRNARSVLERQRRDTPAHKTKNVKTAGGAKGAPINSDINDNFFVKPEFSGRAKTYTEDYPVIFNIMLWFGVVFVFSLLAICIAIADMDPGRDSIIYRMTSNRMKKDN